MAFFDPLPEPDSTAVGEDEEEWAQPKEKTIGGLIPLQLLLAETDEVAVLISGLIVDNRALSLTITVMHRRVPAPRHGRPPLRPGFGLDDPTHDGLRVGVRLSNGTKLEALDGPSGHRGPVLIPQGGHSKAGRSERGYRLEPAPPPGPVTFVCTWPKHGIGETSAVVDGELIATAKAASRTLWPDDPLPDRYR